VLYPQKLVNVPVPKGFDWQGDEHIAAALKQVEARMAGCGRVLLRASGTEPLLRVMVEGENKETVVAEAETLAAVIRQIVQPA
jgi:phosphoglucosamine mutase